ncbi:hypothetical protein AHiyo6_33930, partial [Arthrobacter sp. Hiyo6]
MSDLERVSSLLLSRRGVLALGLGTLGAGALQGVGDTVPAGS